MRASDKPRTGGTTVEHQSGDENLLREEGEQGICAALGRLQGTARRGNSLGRLVLSGGCVGKSCRRVEEACSAVRQGTKSEKVTSLVAAGWSHYEAYADRACALEGHVYPIRPKREL